MSIALNLLGIFVVAFGVPGAWFWWETRRTRRYVSRVCARQDQETAAWMAAAKRVTDGGYVQAIPAPPDSIVTWPGKERGEPKPPIIWANRD